MANSSGTPGGVGSSQGGQQGWDDAGQAQPIPPSREGTTSAGMTGTVYDPSQQGELDMTKAKTDAERAAEAEADAKAGKVAEGEQATTGSVSTDPADQPNFGLPEGVSTSATRGEDGKPEAPPTEGEPLLTVEEQMAGGRKEDTESEDEGDLAEG